MHLLRARHFSYTEVKITLICAILYSSIAFGQTEDPLMYHDFALDIMAKNIKFLATTEEYAKNTPLKEIAVNLPQKLDRHNAKNYELALLYISEEFILTKEIIKKYYSPFKHTKELSNIRHIAAHALADIYNTSKKHKKAITFYNKAMLTNTPEGTSGTTINKDYLRIEFDLSKIYFEQNEIELATLHLLHNYINGQSYGDHLSTTLLKYEKLLDAKRFIPKLDAMLLTLKKGKNYKLEYVFENKNISFCPFMANASSAKLKITNSSFYKNLKKQSTSIQSEPIKNKNIDRPVTQIKKFSIDSNIFYHHKEINSFIRGLLIIKEKDVFINNKVFQSSIDNCIKYLEAGHFYKAKKEMDYIATNSFAIKTILEDLSDNEKKDVENIPHFSAHYQLDMVMNNKNYVFAFGPLQYIKGLPGFDFKSENKIKRESDTKELLFMEASANNGLSASEFSLLHLLGALINCSGYENEINKLMIINAKELGEDRVVKFISQVEINLVKEYSDSLKLVSKPFEVEAINLQKLKYDQIISKIHNSEIYKLYAK